MKLDQLRAKVKSGEIDTVLLALTDMQGRLQGKRLTARHFLDEVAEPRRRRVQLPARRRRRDEHRRRLRDVLVGAGLRRLRRCAPTSPRCGRCRGRRRPRCAWPTSSGPTARDVVASPRQILRAPAGATGRARLDRQRRAPSSSSSCSATPTRRPGTRATASSSRPTSTTSTTRCSATARVEPLIRRIRNEMDGGRAGGRELQGRVQLRPARDQLPLRGRAARRRRARRSTRTAPRRSPPRRAWRSRSWPSSTSARATRATSTSRWPTPKARCSQRDRATFDAFLAGQLACLRELTLLLAPNINSYKRYAAGSFAPTTVAWGDDNRTCALRVVGHGAGAALREPRRRRGPQPVPGAVGADRSRPARGRARAGSSSPPTRATPTSRPTSRGCRRRCATRAICSPPARSRAAAFGEEVVDHYVNAADVELAAFECGRHRLGAAPGLRAAVTGKLAGASSLGPLPEADLPGRADR